MSTAFVAGDMHFDHHGALWHDHRPWPDVENMGEALVAGWNSVVGRKDLTYLVGDFAFKRHGYWLNRLNGRKVLVVGSHDRMARSDECLFAQVVGDRHQPGCIIVRHPSNRGIVLNHYKMWSWPESQFGSFHIYAHDHGRAEENPAVLCCSCSIAVWDWRPVPLDTIYAKLAAKLPAWEAAHKAMNTKEHHERVERRVLETRLENRKWLGLIGTKTPSGQ